jgi:hypothetical protein
VEGKKRAARDAIPGILTGILLFLASCYLFSRGEDIFRPWVFQERDIQRAIELAHGKFIAYGPEVTGGGHLFGPFFYFLLAIPALAGSPWHGAWWLMVMLSSLASVLIWAFLKKNAGASSALLAFGFFALSTWNRRVLQEFYNASYLPVFEVICVISLCIAFMRKRADGRAWLCACLSIGFGCQVHASIFIMLLSGVVLQSVAPYLSLPRLTAKQFCLGLLGVLVPISPYFIVWAMNGNFSGALGGVGEAFGAMAVIVTRPSVALVAPGQAMFWRFLEYTPIPLAVLMGSLLVDQIISGPALEFQEEAWSARKNITKIAAVQSLVALPLIYYYVMAANAYRYMGPYAAPVAIFSALIVDQALKTRARICAFCVLGAALAASYMAITPWEWIAKEFWTNDLVFCSCVGLMIYGFLRGSSRSAGMAIAASISFFLIIFQPLFVWTRVINSPGELFPQRFGVISHYKNFAEHIYRRTGWDFEEVRKRVFFVSAHAEYSLSHAYDLAMAKVNREHGKVPLNANAPSGFFILIDAPDLSALPAPVAEARFQQWFLSKPIPGEIKGWIKAGLLTFGLPERTEASLAAFEIVPYLFSKSNEVPPYIQNIGFQYIRYPQADYIEAHANHRGVERLNGGATAFYWNECPLHEPSCTTGAIVDLNKSTGGRYQVHVTVLGQPLSHLSEWISPRWTEEWNKPFINLKCGKEILNFKLADAIGRSQKYGQMKYGNIAFSSNSILAPYERVFELKCAAGIREISVGRMGSTIIDTQQKEPFQIEVPTLTSALE